MITLEMVAGGATLAEPRLSPNGSVLGWIVRDMDGVRFACDPPGAAVLEGADGLRMPHPSGGGAWHWTADGRAVVAEGEPAEGLTDGADLAMDATRSPDGVWAAWHEWNDPHLPWQQSRIVRRRADRSGEVQVVAETEGVGVSQPRYGPDGRLAWVSDATGRRNVWVAAGDGSGARPVLAEEHEHGGPTWGPGQRSFAWSPDGRFIAFNRNEDGFGRLCVASVDADQPVRQLGKGWHWALAWQGDRIAALRSGAKTPTELVTYDAATGERTRIARGPVDEWDSVDLVEPELVSWAAEDGVEVPGRLYRAPGVERPPLLAWIHGGPTDQLEVSFNARTAFFVERGWAVLAPDHRGSSGRGRAWEDALRHRWGDLDVTDTATGMRWLAESGEVDASRMVPIGGSAGGSTALRLASRFPALCAAAVALYPVVDLSAPTPSRFERHYGEWLVGANAWSIDSLDRPALLLHGADDDVVPAAQSIELAARFPDRIELNVYDGEGHGWRDAAAVADELTRTEAFLRETMRRAAG